MKMTQVKYLLVVEESSVGKVFPDCPAFHGGVDTLGQLQMSAVLPNEQAHWRYGPQKG